MFNRSKAQALALLTAVLVVGAAAGWGLSNWMHRGDRPAGRGDPEAFVSRLTKELEAEPGPAGFGARRPGAAPAPDGHHLE